MVAPIYVSQEPSFDRTLPIKSELYVHEAIAAQARERPNATAIVDGNKTLSYQELDSRSNEVAGHLHSLGLRGNAVVGLCAPRSIVQVIGALGILRAGAAYLPLDPCNPTGRLIFQLEDAKSDALVSGVGSAELGLGRSIYVLLDEMSGALIEKDVHGGRSADVRADDIAYVIYTSGSTGRPKGVEITHGGLSNLISWHRATFRVTETDRASHVAGVGFDAAVWEVWPSLAAGACLYIAPDSVVRDPRALRDWLLDLGITISFTPTPLAERLIEMEWPSECRLRVMLAGGDVLHKRPQRALPYQLVNNYGPSECTVVTTSGTVDPGDTCNTLPPIGRPISNTSVYILDPEKRPVPHGVDGEICISGTGLARGYRNRPELTAERFIANPLDPRPGARLYCTGDRGRFLPDGQVEFLGRTDDQVKIRGYRIEPAEIEAVLNGHTQVQNCAVIPQGYASGDEQIVAYVVLKPPHGTSIREIQSFLRQQLPEWMLPARFVAIDNIPVTPNGKVDRVALGSLRMINGRPENSSVPFKAELATRPPQDDVERRLQRIWKANLEIGFVGTDEDYFELGGDSLRVACLCAQIEESFGIVLPVSKLLETRTIERLARTIRGEGPARRWTSLVAVQPSGCRTPLFCVHNHTGDVLFSRSFPQWLGSDQPVYGLQSRALSGGPPQFVVEDMAAHYIQELRNVQPEGPYRLFGFSFGGLVAFEIARQLLAKQQQVEFLGMFNTPVPGSLEGWPLRQFSYLKRRIANELAGLGTLTTKEAPKHVISNAVNFGRMVVRTARVGAWQWIGKHAHRSAEFLGKSMPDVAHINIAAAKNYVSRGTFGGRITFFVSSAIPYLYAIPPRSGWSEYSTGGVEIVNVIDDGSPLHFALARAVSGSLALHTGDRQATNRA